MLLSGEYWGPFGADASIALFIPHFLRWSQVGLLITGHSWANAGVLLGARVRRRVAFETINYRDEVSERRKVIVN